MKRVLLALFAAAALVAAIQAATGTLMPAPYQVLFDSSGNTIVSGKICTYLAGSSTAVFTYTDVGLSVQNTNPIITDGSGRYVAFLTPGVSYKFVYYSNDGTANTCNGTILRTQDNVAAVPTTANNIDVIGTAGEALTAGQAVYLSAGSGGKVAGLWYLANATNTYSSTTAIVGMVPSSIASGASGSIRLSGMMTGLSGLVVGSDYYVDAAVSGSITVTAPMNVRFIGRADTTTTLILAPSVTPNTSPTYTAKTNNYSAVAYDLVAVTSTSTTTITLPAAASNANKTIWVVNEGTGSVSIVRTSTDTIGLVTSQTLNPATSAPAQGDSMIFISDGISNWNIL